MWPRVAFFAEAEQVADRVGRISASDPTLKTFRVVR